MKTLKMIFVIVGIMTLSACGNTTTPDTSEPAPSPTNTTTSTTEEAERPGEESSDIKDLGLDNARAELNLVE